MKVIYIAGKYRGARPIDVKQNIRTADVWGEILTEQLGQYGLMVLIPHKNTEGYEGLQDDQYFLEGTMELLRRCDAIFLCPAWEQSTGAQGERKEAERLGMPIFNCSDEDINKLEQWLKTENPQTPQE